MELEFNVQERYALKCMELEYEVHGRYAWNWNMRCMEDLH